MYLPFTLERGSWTHPSAPFLCMQRHIIRLPNSEGPSQHNWVLARGLRTRPQFYQERLVCKWSHYLGDLANVATFEWRPTLQNLLFVSSIALAYLAAGSVTPGESFRNSSSGSAMKDPASLKLKELQDERNEKFDKENTARMEDLWDRLHGKLTKSRDSVNNMCVEIASQTSQLNLQALTKDARVRLLLVSLEELQKQVCKLKQDCCSIESGWSNVLIEMLCELITPVCQNWMHKEYLIGCDSESNSKERFLISFFTSGESKSKSAEAFEDEQKWRIFFNSYSEKYEGKKMMMQRVKLMGKAEFYTDFLYFICTGCSRDLSCCTLDTLRCHRNNILEDIVIFIADGAAALYLDMMSAASPISEGQLSSTMAPEISSTRILERFRNEVALNSWLKENFLSVSSIFEDRFDLWICKPFTSPENGSTVSKKDKTRRKSHNKRGQSEVVIEQFKLPVRRIRELRALSGWRYYYSLYLEFSDICGPILRSMMTKFGEAVSFLLVILIGRSLGLIYRGIRQSVQWTSK